MDEAHEYLFGAVSYAQSEARLKMARLMYDRTLKRLGDYEVEVTNRFPHIRSLTDLTFIGSFVWTQTTAKRRWMMKAHAHHIGAWVSPADLARDYLHLKYSESYKMRCRTSQYHALIRDVRSAPLYAKPTYLDNAMYIDLKSAYWQILQALGWDVEYLPGEYLAVKSSVDDFPYEQIKLARNSLVSIGLPSKTRVWTGERFAVFKKQSRWQNLVMWGAVQDVLHGIACDMVQYADAHYVHTDGYIIPSKNIQRAERVAEAWGVIMLVKHHGKAKIRNVGDYDIAGKLSGRPTRQRPNTFSNLRDEHRSWLRSKFRSWSERRQLRIKTIQHMEDAQALDVAVIDDHLTQLKFEI